jgi:uncharacterized protein YbaR (Trm112 family)
VCDDPIVPPEVAVTIDPELLSLLVCPLSRAPLVQDGDTLVSTDPATRRRYRIDDGIPVMLVEESEELEEAVWKAIMEKAG